MSSHISNLILYSSKPFKTIKKGLKDIVLSDSNFSVREDPIDENTSLPVVNVISNEIIRVIGKDRIVRRVYIHSKDSKKYLEYNRVGWMLTEDVNECVVCSVPFSRDVWRHHCRACGNVVCNNCSRNRCVIKEIQIIGPVRVCCQCFWGQVLNLNF